MKLLALAFVGLTALVLSVPADDDYDFEENYINELWGHSISADNQDGLLKVPAIVEKYGYPIEVHEVITEDGYILTLHRIPYGKNCPAGPGKRVAYLQHGLLCDSSNWILNGPEKGLGYNLADECYDVWMGNYRGNTYSKRHVEYSNRSWSVNFWDFSWNEQGLYDLPAQIDYVLDNTGADGVYYVGHSMGTTGFWVMASEKPEYNAKIKLMSALAPVAFTKNMISPLRLISPFTTSIDWLSKMFGLNEFMPTSFFMKFLGQTACNRYSIIRGVCSNILFLIAGYNFDQLDAALVPVIIGHTPAGSSTRNLIHYGQGVNSGLFRKYNYGKRKNRELYGQDTPPEYDLSKITVPVAFYWGENDWLGTKKDTATLAEHIPNLVRNHRVDHDKYNHLDFLFAKDNDVLLNRHVIELMRDY